MSAGTERPAHSIPVYQAVDFSVVNGANLGDPISFAAELDLLPLIVFSLVFGGLVALLFALGVTESRIIGFIGLSRLMVTYILFVTVFEVDDAFVATARRVFGPVLEAVRGDDG